ncbi:hypothetical protein VTK26DRAFT_318 [Humicola hyalothermophila]
MATHKAFVCGGTGTQGGAVARQLRALGWEVRTITRDPNSKAAQALTAIGVTCIAGSWHDEAALAQGLAGCDALFLNVMPSLEGKDIEFGAGDAVLRGAKAAGVRRVVYSSAVPLGAAAPGSVLAASRDQKRRLEARVRELGFDSWTVLQPGYFMTNFLAPMVRFMLPGAAESGAASVAFRPDTRLPLIDPEDIARFAVAALRDPDTFHGKEIRLAAEKPTVEAIWEVVRRGTGRDLRVTYLSEEEAEQAAAANPVLAAQLSAREMGDKMEATVGWGIEMTTFEEFVAREKQAFDETFAQVKKID